MSDYIVVSISIICGLGIAAGCAGAGGAGKRFGKRAFVRNIKQRIIKPPGIKRDI